MSLHFLPSIVEFSLMRFHVSMLAHGNRKLKNYAMSVIVTAQDKENAVVEARKTDKFSFVKRGARRVEMWASPIEE